MKTFLQNNNIKIYATHNEEKSVVAESFIRTFMNKIYNYMISISKNVYIDKLDEIVNKYNNRYHTIIKIKPIDVNPSMYFNFNKENNKEDPTFKVSDCWGISKHKSIFAKDYVPNWSEEIFAIKKVKNTIPRAYVISDLKMNKLL